MTHAMICIDGDGQTDPPFSRYLFVYDDDSEDQEGPIPECWFSLVGSSQHHDIEIRLCAG